MRILCVFVTLPLFVQYSLHVAADEARQRRFLAVERAVICGLIIARLNFPPLQGLRKHTHTHTHLHACIHTFLFVTHSVFSPPLLVLHAFSRCVSSLSQYSQPIEAARGR